MVTSSLVAATVVPQRVGSQISPDIFTCPLLGQAAGCRQGGLTDGLRRRLRRGRLRRWLTHWGCRRLGLWSVGSRRVNWKRLGHPQHFRSWCLSEKSEIDMSRKNPGWVFFPAPCSRPVPNTCPVAVHLHHPDKPFLRSRAKGWGRTAPSGGQCQQPAARADSSVWFVAGIPGLALPVGHSADGRPEWSQLGLAEQLLQP